MFKKSYLIIGAFSASVLMLSCKKEGWQTAPSGLKYWFLKDSEGEKVKEGDVATFHIKYTTNKDSVLFNSFTTPSPLSMPVGKSPFKGSFEEALGMMSPGDSAQFLINTDSLFGKAFNVPVPPFIEKGSYMTFLVKLIESKDPKVYQQEQESKAKEKYESQMKADVAIIENYISEKGIQPQKSSKGVYYTIEKEGKGSIQTGDTVIVHYTGYTLDGKIFDSSRKENGGRGEPFDVPVGMGFVIQGWDEVLPLLQKGTKAKLIIPSPLAYGERETPKFGANSILTFDIEIVNVKPKKQ